MNEIIQGDCLEVMPTLPDMSIDLVVTSPPYDNLRTYNGNSAFDFEGIAKELLRVVKDGGVVVWVVGDATINGSETGTSFKQVLYFKEIGFNLHDTMIWFKPNAMPQVDKTRFTQSFEYMFIFSKGKPKTANPQKVPTKKTRGSTRISNNTENINKKIRTEPTNDFKIGNNVYELGVGAKSFGHPATSPLKLATDHILSWSNEGDTVLDPFAGSGTTGVACLNTGRKYILIEKDPTYCEIIRKRIEAIQPRLF